MFYSIECSEFPQKCKILYTVMNTYSKYPFLLKKKIFLVHSLQMVTFEPFIHASGKNFSLADIYRSLLSTREAA